MRNGIAGLAAAALLIASAAQAAEPVCLTPTEFTALSSYALPSVITGVGQRCSAQLSSDAFLRTEGVRLTGRYATRQQAAWPTAKTAFLKLIQAQNPEMGQLAASMPDSSLRPLADNFIVAAINQKLPTDRCAPIDRMLRLLAPLPPENTAELIGLAAGLGARGDRARIGDISLCPA